MRKNCPHLKIPCFQANRTTTRQKTTQFQTWPLTQLLEATETFSTYSEPAARETATRLFCAEVNLPRVHFIHLERLYQRSAS